MLEAYRKWENAVYNKENCGQVFLEEYTQENGGGSDELV